MPRAWYIFMTGAAVLFLVSRLLPPHTGAGAALDRLDEIGIVVVLAMMAYARWSDRG